MTNAEKKALREKLRAEIKARRESIGEFIVHKGKIPQHIIDGKLSEIMRFKNYAEKIGGMYHVLYEPAKRASHAYLNRINIKLHGIQVALQLPRDDLTSMGMAEMASKIEKEKK